MSPRHGKSRQAGSGRFRIIGGKWRGRRLPFPATRQLRPTPDRVRETVFNWLRSTIDGSRCLDLYSGSGALGLEALSRGAAQCVFVERDAAALDAIRAHCEALGAEGAAFVNSEALRYLKRCERAFDVIFLDPPFDEDPWARLFHRIVAGGLLRPAGRIYIETAAAAGPPSLPAGLELLRSKRAGRVGYHLVSAVQEIA